jgi:hypothetical protein
VRQLAQDDRRYNIDIIYPIDVQVFFVGLRKANLGTLSCIINQQSPPTIDRPAIEEPRPSQHATGLMTYCFKRRTLSQQAVSEKH